MGLLDILSGSSSAASPWGLLYPSPLAGSPDDLAKALAAAGETGLAPGQTSPFGDPSKLSVAPPPAMTGFGTGAAPFGFAGPGSNIVKPSDVAGPAPVPLPQARPAAADAPPAAARPAAAAPADEAPAAPPAAAAPAPAPFSLAGNLNAAGQSFSNSKGFIPRLFNGATALVTGQRTDPAGQAATATAQALIAKGAPLADVQAATNNPTLMQALINQYYGKEKYSVVQTGESADGGKQFSVFNTQTGEHKAIGADASEPGGTVVGPDGKAISIPAGVNRKEFIKRVTESTADAATGKQTEAQAKASSFAARMEQAEASMGGLQKQGLSLTAKALDAIPGGVGNYGQSKEYQQYKQAQSAFITALLRQESGAAINKSEFDRYEKELFPQPGDSPAVVSQKQAMRASAVQQMRRAAGPGYQSAAPAASGTTSNGISWSAH
jgi:hypothetical protein